MSTEDDVRKASKQFYAGLNRMANGDAAPLADSWSHSAAVTTMHLIFDILAFLTLGKRKKRVRDFPMFAWHYSEKPLQPYISVIPELHCRSRISPIRRAT
ncbi:MAG: hypothetical protein ACYTGS_20140 [Planctomycetota bacterium]|jgi:hypothetical protein